MKKALRALTVCASASLLMTVYLFKPGSAATQHTSDSRSSQAAASHCLPVKTVLNNAGKVAHEQILIRGGEFVMGRNDTYLEERPQRRAAVEDYYIDSHEVTNAQFRAFVEATNYITTAERTPDPAAYPDIPVDKLVAGSASFVKLEDRPEGAWRDW